MSGAEEDGLGPPFPPASAIAWAVPLAAYAKAKIKARGRRALTTLHEEEILAMAVVCDLLIEDGDVRPGRPGQPRVPSPTEL